MVAIFKVLQRSAFSVQRSAFSVQRSAFSVQRSAFSVQRWLISSQFSHKNPSITLSLPNILGGLFVVQNLYKLQKGGAQ